MATVQGGQQHQKGGYHTKEQIDQTQRPAKARDDLKGAFAGDENDGPFGEEKSHQHSTELKSRKTEQSKLKTPKM